MFWSHCFPGKSHRNRKLPSSLPSYNSICLLFQLLLWDVIAWDVHAAKWTTKGLEVLLSLSLCYPRSGPVQTLSKKLVGWRIELLLPRSVDQGLTQGVKIAATGPSSPHCFPLLPLALHWRDLWWIQDCLSPSPLRPLTLKEFAPPSVSQIIVWS